MDCPGYILSAGLYAFVSRRCKWNTDGAYADVALGKWASPTHLARNPFGSVIPLMSFNFPQMFPCFLTIGQTVKYKSQQCLRLADGETEALILGLLTMLTLACMCSFPLMPGCQPRFLEAHAM